MLAPVLLFGCVSADPPHNSPGSSAVRSKPAESVQDTPDLDPLVPVPPPSVLTPLPTTAQVQDSVGRGRVDPFAPVVETQAGSVLAASPEGDVSGGGALSLQGVMAVGAQVQAFVSISERSGAICVGPAGRCSGSEGEALLPQTWIVRSIDLQRGCLTYTVAGTAQEPVCMQAAKL